MASILPGIAAVLLAAASLLPLMAVASLPADRAGTVAEVFPPGISVQAVLRAVLEADGQPLRSGGWSNVVIVHGTEPGFAGRLRRAGAWLVLDPLSATGCLTSNPPRQGNPA